MSREKSTERLTVLRKQKDIAKRIAAVEALGKANCPRCDAPYQRGRFPRPYFICNSCGHRWSENPVTDALGDWLSKLHKQYPWDWFATLTFAGKRLARPLTVVPRSFRWLTNQGGADITPDGASYFVWRFLQDAGTVGAAKPYAFVAGEYGPMHGRYHIHALVGNVGHLKIYCHTKLGNGEWGRQCCWLHRWPCGRARIFPYDATRGANYYLSKYVVKAIANWELVGFERENLVFKAEH